MSKGEITYRVLDEQIREMKRWIEEMEIKAAEIDELPSRAITPNAGKKWLAVRAAVNGYLTAISAEVAAENAKAKLAPPDEKPRRKRKS